MRAQIEGLHVNVTVSEGIASVTVSLPNGDTALSTDRLSTIGLRNAAKALEAAADMATVELEAYWTRVQAEMVKRKRASEVA